MNILKSFKIILLRTSKSVRTVLLLLFLAILLPTKIQAVEVAFNKVFMGTGNTYTRNSQNIILTGLLAGSSFKFISEIPSDPTLFSGGNDIEGNLQYINGQGATVTVFGTISRKSSVGSTTQSFCFEALVNSGVYTGEAYELIMTPYDSLFMGNQTVGTNSAGVEDALNAIQTSCLDTGWY